ncbi:unnamed protein product [Calypogeia fissa]
MNIWGDTEEHDQDCHSESIGSKRRHRQYNINRARPDRTNAAPLRSYSYNLPAFACQPSLCATIATLKIPFG